MELFLQYFPGFMLVFCRIASFFVVVPVFSTRNVPATFKIGLAFFVSLITFTAVGAGSPQDIDGEYILYILREVLVGLLLGFVAYLFFTVAQIAGSFIDMQMGFGIANMIDPMTGASSPMMGNFKFMLAMLLFLSFNGHHYLLQAIVGSYQWIPLSNELFARIYSGDVSLFLLQSFTSMFTLAFQLAAPLIVAMFLADVGLGILAKTAPQFNIFVVGLPLKILLGFMLLILLIPSFTSLFQDWFEKMFAAMHDLLQLIASK